MALLKACQIVGMDAFADLLHRRREAVMIDAEDAALALVPEPGVACHVAVPGAHMAGGQRQAPRPARSCAAGRSRRSSASVRSATRLLQFLIELLQLAGLAEQFGEHPHLGAQQFRHHRHGEIIDRARLIAAQIIGLRHMNGGNEDDRGLLEARMLADHLGQLEAVQLGHADIHQDDRDLRLEQIGQRFLGGRGRDRDSRPAPPASPHS